MNKKELLNHFKSELLKQQKIIKPNDEQLNDILIHFNSSSYFLNQLYYSFTKEELINLIKAKEQELGRLPSKNEISLPIQIFENVFGSWEATIKEVKKNDIKHIVSFSGGKDSTAMLLMMLERESKQYPIAEIIFCDTGKEFPALYRHLDKIERYIDRPITRVTYKYSFDYMMFEHEKTKGKHIGKKGYGWADSQARWCTDRFKTRAITDYIKEKYGTYYKEYVGIAYDEFKRYEKTQNGHKLYPLIEWKITEGMALKYCYDKGFDWEGLYTHFDRVSCWCCPLKNQRELYMLYSFYPELWAELKDMDSRAWNQYHRNHSVLDYENMFIKWQNGVV